MDLKKNSNPVFVYGSLKHGHYNHSYLSGARPCGNYETNPQWGLIDLGAFPALVMGSLSVKGEVYLIDDETLARLDRLEGVSSGFYKRINIEVHNNDRTINAFTYLLCDIPNNRELFERWD
jgi:gamma-glutamylcyclotransferase (GGCT)/AIG2-like uncharacterized protein YtfP